MGKPRHYDPNWVIEQDESHPDPRVAAKYADENARQATVAFYTRRINRLLENDKLTDDQHLMLNHLLTERANVLVEIENAKEEAD